MFYSFIFSWTVVLFALTTSKSYADKKNASSLLCSTSVTRLLNRMDARGYNYIYSHELVKPWMQALKSEVARRPKKKDIDPILHRYGLRTQPGPNDSILIVKNQEVPKVDTLIVGRIIDLEKGTPVREGDIVVSSEHSDLQTEQRKEADDELVFTKTDNHGCFILAGIPVGEYTLNISAKDSYHAIEKKLKVLPEKQQQLDISVSFAEPSLIEELKIVGTHFRVASDDSSSAMSFDRQSIESLPTIARDVQSVLRRMPGIVASDNVGLLTEINLRGGASNEVRTHIDGVEIINPYFVSSLLGGIFSSVDTDIVDEMTVLTGAYSAEYGNAMSGVINVKTNEDTATYLTDQRRHKIGVEGGGLSSVYGKTEGSFNDNKGFYQLFMKRSNFNNGNPVYNLEYSPNSAPTFKENFAKLHYSFDDVHTLSANILQNDDTSRLIVSRLQNRPEFFGSASSSYAWLRATSDWNDSLSSVVTLSRGHDERSRKTIGILDEQTTGYIGLQAHMDFQFHPNYLLKTGFRVRDLEAEYRYVADFGLNIRDINGDLVNARFMADTELSPRGQDYHAYVSLQSQITDKWLIETGVRWDQQTYTETTQDQLSPRINAAVDLNDYQSIHFGWSQIYQAQSIHELQLANGLDTFQPEQKVEHTVVGFNQRIGDNMNFKIEAYQKKYDDLQERFENQPLSALILYKETNIANTTPEAETKGIELSWQHRVNSLLSWWSNYSYSEATDEIEGESIPRGWDQRNTFNLGGELTWRSWHFSGIFFYHSGRPIAASRQPSLVRGQEGIFFVDLDNGSMRQRIDSGRGSSFSIRRDFSIGNRQKLKVNFSMSSNRETNGSDSLSKIGVEWLF